ncbi:cathepsin L [Folsomia candida]|uniref:cathepsin L n=1 Tax=Folsomia candida TaxID=158441 RepID=UPI0016052FEB|nr:cathepsin L [Folsomia candida]
MNGFKAPNRTDVQVDGQSETISSAATSYSPPPMDWRWLGFVTPVKNQGSCGSCWSFSATGAMEGMHKRRTDVLPNLSEQNLIDCSSDYGNLGCKGGYMINAFNYVIRNRGINTQASYPYRGEQDFCQYRSDTNAVTGMTGYVRVTQGDEIALEDAVRRIGPLFVFLPLLMQYYSSGIFNDNRCSSCAPNHAVLVVGYGTDSSGNLYWIVKNSWGTSWGEQGYFRLARRAGNMCGIASYASYPTARNSNLYYKFIIN